MFLLALFLAVGTAYIIGSVSPSYLAGRLIQGIDLREHGSGNLGASNALRVLGKKLGIIVLLLDVVKGYLVVWMGMSLGKYFGLGGEELVFLGVAAGMAVILGHIYTCFLGFKGGKGVATGLGVFLYLGPGAVAGALVVFALTLFTTRYISLGSMLGAVSLVLLLWLQRVYCPHPPSLWVLFLAAVVAVVVITKHSSNIQRLLAGCENKINWN